MFVSEAVGEGLLESEAEGETDSLTSKVPVPERVLISDAVTEAEVVVVRDMVGLSD